MKIKKKNNERKIYPPTHTILKKRKLFERYVIKKGALKN